MRQVIVNVDAKMHDVIGESPRLSLEHGCCDGMSTDQLKIEVEHVFHLLRVDVGMLLLESAFQAVV
jgi:hypothetical protein